MDLVLIRHPAVDIDAGVCYGQTDAPLLRDANETAGGLLARMRALNVPDCIDGWHSSPLRRCASLAHALGSASIDARLAEMHFGAWEGCAWNDIDRAMIDAWAADLEHARPHGGESLAQFSARVTDWFDDASADASRTMHVVAHAGVMRVLAARLLRLDHANVLQWALDFEGIVWLRRMDAGWIVVRWNA
ncbi:MULTISPECIES: alpha-ribazole phosphatase family protein [unclassified Caballeronia]|uniref:alpha-ribazole phosphatase family protein n=1 Tax=unclassified Caballeronia TaxID=2646786 RepID=UPI0028564D4F|nr:MULTISPECIES: alpha-ribazole phosphatase family protein [unclassified Caballeronia]MDR5736430.1 alpha-ribazole phosphatase family protein [Caballeronia sp. LZ016]MDR5811093.1 alpha-ribazole phosphatase family protein [Caballeronia sp. LZ019]